jgi:hypothetical protein
MAFWVVHCACPAEFWLGPQPDTRFGLPSIAPDDPDNRAKRSEHERRRHTGLYTAVKVIAGKQANQSKAGDREQRIADQHSEQCEEEAAHATRRCPR